MAKTKHAKSQQSTRTTDHTASLTYLYRATVLEFGRFSNLVSPSDERQDGDSAWSEANADLTSYAEIRLGQNQRSTIKFELDLPPGSTLS
jgi:hypothetical protein